MAAAANGAASQSDRKGVFTVMVDSADQPRLKGHGRIRRTRFSIKRHLQKHGLASADSDSDLEEEEEEREWRLHTHTHTHVTQQRRVSMVCLQSGTRGKRC